MYCLSLGSFCMRVESDEHLYAVLGWRSNAMKRARGYLYLDLSHVGGLL